MRVGIVRSDIGKVYLSDVENRSQRSFSSEPAGQSRYFTKPSDAALLAVLAAKAILSAKGNNTSATSNTTGGNNVLRIRASNGSFSVITVTSNAALPKAQLVSELNAGFANAGLLLKATLLTGGDANKVQIDTVGANAGPAGDLEIDTTSNGSTLNAALHSGWAASPPNLNGLTVAALKTAVYPSATTIDVSSATVLGLSTFGSLQASDSAALLAAVQDAVAPSLVETGPVLLSFAYGILSKLRSASFQPGGARIGLPAGVGVAIVANDGSTVFTL